MLVPALNARFLTTLNLTGWSSRVAITIRNVAERAGVSVSAVSRTFTPGASVSAKTRSLVEAAARELGYEPNALASSLTTGRTQLVGLISDNFHNPIFLEVFDRFTRSLQDRGFKPLLVNLTDETDPETSVRMLRRYSVDGVIVASSTLPASFAEAFFDAALPVVHSFGRVRKTSAVPVAGIDNRACGRMAAETLLVRGYRRIGFLGGPEIASSTVDRWSGFRSALTVHPSISLQHCFAETYSFAAGRAAMLAEIARGPAEAYFCGDDVLSIGALSAITGAGLDVPGDIGLIGLNDMEMAGWENINLTTIRQPVAQIIETSVEMIEALMRGETQTLEAASFPCEIVERGTLRPL